MASILARSLNPSVNFLYKVFSKNVYNKPPRCVNDDTWSFNTQSSSQWDGLRHFGYQKERKFYNGVTLDDIHGENKSNILGIHGKYRPAMR